MKPLQLAAIGAALLLIPACSSSSDQPSVPTTLLYANPPATGFSLQADPTTNGTGHLVLNLVGPTGMVAQGVSFFVTANPQLVTWSKTATGLYATAGTAFTLGAAPQAFTTKLSATGGLQVGIYQKTGSVALGTAPIVSLALDLASASVAPGPVALSQTPGQSAVYVDGNGKVQTLTTPIAIGTLTVQ